MSFYCSNPTIERILIFINANFDKPITPRDVAGAMHYSLGHLSHVTRKTMGCSVGDLILQRRLDVARELLTETVAPVAWIASRAGFTDIAYFSRRFSQQMGASPSQWRKFNRSGISKQRMCDACGQPMSLIAAAQYGSSEIREAAS